MIKLLHSADWHLDSPLLFRDSRQAEALRSALSHVPEKIAALCKDQACDLLLLSGDLFDGPYTPNTLRSVQNALEEVSVPVFISPGNHDFIGADSPWLTENFPKNVHIFAQPVMESVAVSHLDCRIYGAGFTHMDCPGLLENFAPEHTERYGIGVLHGDPTQVNSPYNPITRAQVSQSALDYLALGHIHKGDQFRAGKTLCAWPGCPMGRGYDETGDKGVLLVTLEDTANAEFISLGLPQFHDLELDASLSPDAALPSVGNSDFYRLTFTGPSEPLDLDKIAADLSHFPNLELRDRTTPPVDIWGSAEEDTFEGMYFRQLRTAMENAEESQKQQLLLAAKLSRQLLDGQEVVLP